MPRLTALDLLRGVAVAGMVLVNNPGDWGSVYPPLLHAEWHGWTVTDMVFPTFLFGVGVALGLSFPKALSEPADRRLFWRRVGRRVAALVLLGLALEATYNLSLALAGAPGAGLESLRLPGVLQRIGICYGLAAIVIVATARRDVAGRTDGNGIAIGLVAVLILLAYWAALTFVAVPGFGAGRLDQAGSLTAFIDRAVFTPQHLWARGWASEGGPVVYDPEGLLSSLPATVNVLLGALAAVAWKRAPDRAAAIVATGGALLFVAGLLLNQVFAINKSLWTSSFALLSSGFSALLLAALALAARSDAAMRAMAPLRVLGGNAIMAYVLATLLARVLDFPFRRVDGSTLTPKAWANGLALQVVGDPMLASLLCALAMVAVVTLIVWPFHRRGLHFRL